MRFVRNPPPVFSGSGEAIGDWEIFYHLFDGIDPADRKATPGCIGYHIGTLEKDGLGHGLVTCLEVLQEFAFHVCFLSPPCFDDGGGISCGRPDYARPMQKWYEKSALSDASINGIIFQSVPLREEWDLPPLDVRTHMIHFNPPTPRGVGL